MPRWSESQLRDVVAASDSLSEVLGHFELRAAGGNFAHLRRWLERWDISTDHFTYAARRRQSGRPARVLVDVLVEHSKYHRGKLKRRLYDEGVKQRSCELCGQDEMWHGNRMSLILDHVNGVHDDNRLENLRIVCANCNATLPTHCGRNRPPANPARPCGLCGEVFAPKAPAQVYCSRACWQRTRRGVARTDQRRVERPPYEQLMREIETSSWSAVGRKYGVSCNAVRKWVQTYQWQAAEATTPARGERRGAA